MKDGKSSPARGGVAGEQPQATRRPPPPSTILRMVPLPVPERIER